MNFVSLSKEKKGAALHSVLPKNHNTMSKVEKWVDIPNYEGVYKVSNLGRVLILNYKRSQKPKIQKLGNHSYGYIKTVLVKGGKPKTHLVHRLVMLAFVGDSKLQVNHINGIKTDNRLENLEYCTQSQNMRHADKLGLRNIKGQNHPNSKITRIEAKNIKYGHPNMTQKEIAQLYNVSHFVVSDIRRGKSWRHI